MSADGSSGSLSWRLATVYGWAAAAFAALDLGKANTINLQENGPIISRALCEGGLQHLWTILEEAGGADGVLSQSGFLVVFFAWMGIDDTFESRLRSGAPISRVHASWPTLHNAT